MGFGEPVWHVSVSRPGGGKVSQLRQVALRVLNGVGDRAKQWEERGAVALHVRRRISAAEELIVGPALDIRGTPEVAERLAPVAARLPDGWTE